MTPRKTSYLFAGIWANNIRYPESESKQEKPTGDRIREWLGDKFDRLTERMLLHIGLPFVIGLACWITADKYLPEAGVVRTVVLGAGWLGLVPMAVVLLLGACMLIANELWPVNLPDA